MKLFPPRNLGTAVSTLSFVRTPYRSDRQETEFGTVYSKSLRTSMHSPTKTAYLIYTYIEIYIGICICMYVQVCAGMYVLPTYRYVSTYCAFGILPSHPRMSLP